DATPRRRSPRGSGSAPPPRANGPRWSSPTSAFRPGGGSWPRRRGPPALTAGSASPDPAGSGDAGPPEGAPRDLRREGSDGPLVLAVGPLPCHLGRGGAPPYRGRSPGPESHYN